MIWRKLICALPVLLFKLRLPAQYVDIKPCSHPGKDFPLAIAGNQPFVTDRFGSIKCDGIDIMLSGDVDGSFGVSRLSYDGNFILVENAVHGNTEQTSGRDDRILRSLPGNKTAVIFSSGHKKTVSQVLS